MQISLRWLQLDVIMENLYIYISLYIHIFPYIVYHYNNKNNIIKFEEMKTRWISLHFKHTLISIVTAKCNILKVYQYISSTTATNKEEKD